MATGIAIAAGISATVSWYQAKKAGDAAEEQAQSGRDAMSVQERVYNQQRADVSPYQMQGQSALGNMSIMAGAARPVFTPGGGSQGGAGGFGTMGAIQAQPAPIGGSLSRPGGLDGMLGRSGAAGLTPSGPAPGAPPPRPQLGMPQGPPPGQIAAQPAPGGQMALMRGPDGSTRPVPAHLVAQALQAGAVRVG